MTVDQVVALLSPEQRVAMTLWGEARGSSKKLREGIASAIANRAAAKNRHWGLTPDAVCLKPWQFSCWRPEGGKMNHVIVLGQAKRIIAGQMPPPILADCLAIAHQVCAGTHEDSVKGATHYYAPAAMVPKDRVPDWAEGLEPVAVIDATRFYAGVK